MHVKTVIIKIGNEDRGVSAVAAAAAAVYFFGGPPSPNAGQHEFVLWLSNPDFARLLWRDFGWTPERSAYDAYTEKQQYKSEGMGFTLYGT
jgi:hypothetical protein